MELNFPLLSYESETKQYRFIPITLYHISSEYGLPDNYVVLYNLTLDIKGDKVKSYNSIIPYYLSNGHTNKLRANMLYPFICFNQPDILPTKCPSNSHFKNPNKLIPGGLYKYQLSKNLTFDEINIEAKIIRRTPNDLRRWQNKITGIASVLPRITNLVDFIIAIHSEKIINFSDDHHSDDYDKYYIAGSRYTDDIKKYRPNKYYPLDFDAEPNNEENINDDEYRNQLIIFFYNMIKNFNKFTNLNVTFIKLTSSDISMDMYNNLQNVRICNKHNEIDNERQRNTEYYHIIAVNFFNTMNNFFKKITDYTHDIFRTQCILIWGDSIPFTERVFEEEYNEWKNFVMMIKNIFIKDYNYSNYSNILSTTIRGWGCTM
jgi:hypothetical protein